MMAKSEAAPKQAKQPKPRLRQVKELMLVEPIQVPGGARPHFFREGVVSITADLDSQVLTLKVKGSKTYSIPFCRAKYWVTDVGTVAAE